MEIKDLNILIIDDVCEILQEFEDILNNFGVSQISKAKTAAEAKKVAPDLNNLDIVFCDWHLPDSTGLDLLTYFKKNYPKVYFLIFTSETDKKIITQAFENGSDGLFFKPLKKENITQNILKYLKSINSVQAIGNNTDQIINELYEKELYFLQEIFKSTSDFVIVLDFNFMIIKVNRSFCNAVGLSEGELIGKSIKNFVPIKSPLLECLRKGQMKTEQRIEFIAIDGEVHQTLLTMNPIEKESLGISGLLLLAKSIKHELELQNELAIALKDECIAGLASGMSHENNNSLMILLGKLLKLERSLHNKGLLEVKDQELIDNIRENSHRIHHITQALKEYTQENTNKFEFSEKLKLEEIITHILSLVDIRLKNSHIYLQLNNYDSHFYLNTNKNLLNKVILQIIENSIHAVANLNHKSVELFFEYDDYLSITFIDSGNGVPFELKDKVFDPFFTTGIFGKDKGLGMSVSRGIMKKIGGDLVLQEISSQLRVKLIIPYK
ncbi:MAG: response regulator [Halobacteriovoraceae bacterium]|nr:response regulator [Halobacteriovoraceae bacterium]